jgi:general secretion pathway protein D
MRQDVPEELIQAARAASNPQPTIALAAHEAAPEEQAKAVETFVTRSYSPTTRSALDLSRQVHEAFAKRSELVDVGRKSLPGFKVHAVTAADALDAGKVLFEVELDTENEEIHVHAPGEWADRMVKLFQRLDVPPESSSGKSVQFVAENGNTAEVAKRLQPTLTQLAQFRAGAESAGQATGERPEADVPQQPGQDVQPGMQLNALPLDVADEVRGDVTVQYVEGVGLILIGNRRDIDAVARVIQAVEQMAVGSLPRIELLILKNVDSESLATLLTDVYTDLTTIRNRTNQQQQTTDAKQIAIRAVGTPNAILVIAPGTMMDSVLDVATQLDQPVDPESEIEVFHLKYAVASQVDQKLTDFYADARAGLGTTVRHFADIRTNAIIVQARPRNMTEIRDLIEKLDRDKSDSVLATQRVPLRFAVADEMQQFLSRAIQTVLSPPQQQNLQTGQAGQIGGGVGAGQQTQAPQELRDSKAVVLEFLTSDGNSERLIRSGLLTDVKITSEPRTNSLLVSAPAQSMTLVLELIRVLDTPSATTAAYKVFVLKNADAVATAELLQTLFTPGGTNQNQGQGGQQQAQGIQIVGATETSSVLIPMVFQSDPRTNSIIALGGPDALTVVEAILSRLDNSESKLRKREVLRLRNTPAADIANALTLFLQQIRDIASIDPDRITVNQLLDQEIIVQAEPISNNLLISATPRYFDDIVRIARALDREPQQVMIQTMIVEVQLSNDTEFGIELGFQDPLLFNRSVAGVPGFLFNNAPLGNNTTAPGPSSVGEQGLSSFALGRTSSELGFGGLVLSASSNSVSALLRALSATSNVQILSRPQILAVDNQIAEITVGQTVPRANGATVTNGVVQPQVVDTDVGIILSVIPRITPEGKIIMELIANKSALSGQSVVILADAASGTNVTSPIINKTRAQTTIKVPDGQTVVVGGMITTNDNVTTSKVPWLGDLPVIGHAFRYDQLRNDRTELLIFLTPRIMYTDLDAEIIKQVEAERTHFFEEDVEESHGPLFELRTPRNYYDPTQHGTLGPHAGLPGYSVEGGTSPTLPMGGSGATRPDLVFPPGTVLPPGYTLPPGASMDGPLPGEGYEDYEGSPAHGGPVLHPWPIDPPSNSRRVRDTYGNWFGREPLPH